MTFMLACFALIAALAVTSVVILFLAEHFGIDMSWMDR